MIRKAFLMEAKRGRVDEYERWHNPIWPELHEIFKRQGVHNYSIFHDEATDQLFGYVEIEDEARWNAIAETEVCQRWWRHMKDVLVSDDLTSPKAKEQPMREVFHID